MLVFCRCKRLNAKIINQKGKGGGPKLQAISYFSRKVAMTLFMKFGILGHYKVGSVPAKNIELDGHKRKFALADLVFTIFRPFRIGLIFFLSKIS